MQRIFSLLALLIFSFSMNAQNNTDAILGIWETEKKDAKIEVFKSGNEYKAKLLWGVQIVNKDGSSKKDVNNKDEKLRSRDLVNSIMIKGLNFDGDDEWKNGKVYNNANGKWYNCYVWLKKGKLHLRGYLGIPAFGQTSKWNRLK